MAGRGKKGHSAGPALCSNYAISCANVAISFFGLELFFWELTMNNTHNEIRTGDDDEVELAKSPNDILPLMSMENNRIIWLPTQTLKQN